jgi:hypothetical protein
MNLATGPLIAATVTSATACGATLDHTFKQLPAATASVRPPTPPTHAQPT